MAGKASLVEQSRSNDLKVQDQQDTIVAPVWYDGQARERHDRIVHAAIRAQNVLLELIPDERDEAISHILHLNQV